MLNSMRRGANTIVAKALFGILMLSFAAWGVGSAFQGGGQRPVATLGDINISAEAFRQAYTDEVQRIARRLQRTLSPDESRALGLDQRVLSRTLYEAALDQEAKRLGILISDADIVNMVAQSSAFKGPDGQFSRFAFESALRNNNLTEASFLQIERTAQARQLLLGALASGIVPPAAVEASEQTYGQERRALRFIEVTPQAVTNLPEPDEAALSAFFEQRKAVFRLPEKRDVDVLEISPEKLAKSIVIPSDELNSAIAARRTQFDEPERRRVSLLVVPTQQEAEQALANVQAGKSLSAINTQLGRTDKDLELGLITRDDLADDALRQPVFSLPLNKVSGVLKGSFGYALAEVREVLPAKIRPEAEVREIVQNSLKESRARDKILELHDRIEDQRAGGATLAEIAAKDQLQLLSIKRLTRNGQSESSNSAGLMQNAEALQTIFASEKGIEIAALNVGNGGYLWLDLKEITPSRERRFDEAKEDVRKAFQAEETRKRMAEIANEWLTEARAKGLSAFALQRRLSMREVSNQPRDLASSPNPVPFSPRGLSAVFAAKIGDIGVAEATDGVARVLYVVEATSQAPQEPAALDEERKKLGQQMAEDLAAAIIADLQKTQGLKINQDVLMQIVGTSQQ